jgi:hypothetical protein
MDRNGGTRLDLAANIDLEPFFAEYPPHHTVSTL